MQSGLLRIRVNTKEVLSHSFVRAAAAMVSCPLLSGAVFLDLALIAICPWMLKIFWPDARCVWPAGQIGNGSTDAGRESFPVVVSAAGI